MITEVEQDTCVSTTVRTAALQFGADRQFQRAAEIDHNAGLFSLVRSAPVTFAERFPHLMVGVVAVGVLLAALTAEIECLRGSGYYWQ